MRLVLLHHILRVLLALSRLPRCSQCHRSQLLLCWPMSTSTILRPFLTTPRLHRLLSSFPSPAFPFPCGTRQPPVDFPILRLPFLSIFCHFLKLLIKSLVRLMLSCRPGSRFPLHSLVSLRDKQRTCVIPRAGRPLCGPRSSMHNSTFLYKQSKPSFTISAILCPHFTLDGVNVSLDLVLHLFFKLFPSPVGP